MSTPLTEDKNKLTKRANCLVWTDGLTLIIEKLCKKYKFYYFYKQTYYTPKQFIALNSLKC